MFLSLQYPENIEYDKTDIAAHQFLQAKTNQMLKRGHYGQGNFNNKRKVKSSAKTWVKGVYTR